MSEKPTFLLVLAGLFAIGGFISIGGIVSEEASRWAPVAFQMWGCFIACLWGYHILSKTASLPKTTITPEQWNRMQTLMANLEDQKRDVL